MPSPPDPATLPVTPERISRLRTFGLSEYAARAYLALLDLGTTEARDVAALSKVPASKIYHILDQLHEKGLVVVLPEFPRKYAPVPFAEFLRRIHAEHAAAALQIEAEETLLAHMFAVVGDTAAGDRGSVTLLRGRRNVQERASEVIASAQSDLLMLVTKQQALDGRAWEEPLRLARARGVDVRVLGDAVARPAELPASTFAIIADRKRAFLGQAMPDDGHPLEGQDTGLDVDQEGIVALFAALLDARWTRAGPGRSLVLDAPGA